METLSSHIDALRKTVFSCVLILAVGFIIAFSFSDLIVHWMTEPVKPLIHQPFALFSPAEGFMIALKISLWASLLFTAPLWAIPLSLFFLPALHPHEKKAVIPFILLSLLFLALGIVLAYKVTLPLTNEYFWQFNETLGVNLWGLKAYTDYALMLILSHAIGFEGIAALIILVHTGIIPYEFLASKRRHALVISLILGALLTPPDVLSQLFLAVPLYLGYELTLLYGYFIQRKRRAVRSSHVLG